MRIVTAAVAALALAATALPAASAASAAPQDPPSATDGVWRMDGYGTLLVLGGGALREYQTTAVSCVEGDSARQTGPGTYTTPDGTALTVRTTPGRAHARLAADRSVGHRWLTRIRALPAACTRPPATDPRADFDVL